MSAAPGVDADAVLRDLGSACPVEEATPADAVAGVSASVVARPRSTRQTAEVLRAAATHRLVVVPRGAGTKLAWGRPPERVDLVLDTTGMDQVLDHAAGDLIVDVEAGARLAHVDEVVASAEQRLMLDETCPGATIGGTLAANASGPVRVAAGTARDLMIGCTVVRADGVVATAGGRVVKNVAGYDVGKLAVGSFGTLAVITRAAFRLHPRPPARSVVSVAVDGPDAAHRLVHAVVGSQLVPAAVELDDDARAGPGGATLSVLLEGTERGVAARSADLLGLLGEGATASQQTADGWGAYPWAPGGTGLKLTFALTGLRALLAAVASAAASTGTGVSLRGSAGDGVLHAGLAPGTAPEVVIETLVRLRAVCAEHGGAAVVLTAPPDVEEVLTGPADGWGPVPALALMRAVKERFDPERRLAPGRFVGGI